MEHERIELDAHVLDGLMVDLVRHDRRPGAYILYLTLLRMGGGARSVSASLQGLATASGLSKTSVQRSVGHLERRRLITVERAASTDIPRYRVNSPWRRRSIAAS